MIVKIKKLKVHEQSLKGMVAWGWISNFITLVSGIFIVFFSIKKFNDAELSAYFLLVNFVSIMTLLDFGYGQQLTKKITYLLCGAKEILKSGIVEKIEPEINLELYNSVIKTSIKYYKILAFITALLSFLVLIAYSQFTLIKFKAHEAALFSLSIGLMMLGGYIQPILNGGGLVVESRKLIINSRLIFTITFVVTANFDFGVMSYTLGLLISNVYLIIFGNKFNLERMVFGADTGQISFDNYKLIATGGLYVGAYFLATSLAARSGYIIGGLFLNEKQLSVIGITLQLVSIIISFSMMLSSVLQTKLSSQAIRRDAEAIKTLGLTLRSSLFLSFLGMISMTLLGQVIFDLFEIKIQLPDKFILLLLCVFTMLEVQMQCFISYLASENKYTFVKSSVLTCVTSYVALWLIFKFSNFMTKETVIMLPYIGQLVYNYWYWPRYVCSERKIDYRQLMCGS